MKKINLSVTDFALPAPRKGSIESQSGLSGAIQLGRELHEKIQKLRIEEIPNYEAEVSTSIDIEIEGFLLRVSGRMDGFVDDPNPRIEEIKSTFNLFELKKSILEKTWDHPYYLQLQTYGYIKWKKTGIKPALQFTLVSHRTFEEVEVEIDFDLRGYESWLKRRLPELAIEAKRALERSLRRRVESGKLVFPFPTPREGQRELIDYVKAKLSEKTPMMLQAPTGLGKTLGILYPSLEESLSRGQRVIYVTPKNSQQAVAEEAVTKFQDGGSKVKSLTLTAKSKLCFKAEPLCDPEYCEFAKDHYDKLHRNDLKGEILKKKKITARVVKNLAKKHEVCPFELQLEAASEMDVIICDYNYVFSNRSVLNRLTEIEVDQSGKPNLVIDEAHNLPGRAMSYYSPSLSLGALLKLKEEAGDLPKKFRSTAADIIDSGIKVLKDLQPKSGKSEIIRPSLDQFLLVEEDLRKFLSKYLDSTVEIKPRDPVLRLVFYWAAFTEVLGQVLAERQSEFFISFQVGQRDSSLKITCCDASKMLQTKYQAYENVIAFSATLKPFEYYSQLSGLKGEKLNTQEFRSPFNPEKRKILIIPQISTRYSVREKNYSRIAETIARVSSLKLGNYLALFPSFDFLEKTLALLKIDKSFRLIKQERTMKNDEVQEILEELRGSKIPTIVLGVQGGHFSEGVDYPGDMLIGSFVIGPPLPHFDYEREKMKDYYETSYNQGFEYAYTYPAMAKAVQSAGRVIRTESDRGLIILMDDRFLEPKYYQSMPSDWYRETPKELVSASILKDLKEFWERG